ncbi:SRC1 [Candida margitis]|uniref:SRC1 n=1 Tax=Candida margitis TaxID=1775924 RepID=UPI0022278C35|nr:SRC1 [Candida margitis]KAI5958481.1 SRC1 [Candida margitis]
MEYLQPGFDPSSLKVAKLRNILNLHGVDFPSSAKKAELVSIFEKEIVPRGPELLAEYTSRIDNSHDKGFVNATDNDDETEEQINEVTPRKEKKTKKGTAEPTPEISMVNTENAKVVKPKAKKISKSKDDKDATEIKGKKIRTSKNSEQRQSANAKQDVDEAGLDISKTEQESEIENSESDATENLSSFSDQNVFQSGKESSKASRKRKLKSKDDSVPAKKLKSPPSSKTRVTKSPSKSIFDDTDSDIFDYTIIEGDDKKKHKNFPLAGNKSPTTSSNKTVQSPPASANEESFKSLEEEMSNFDKQLEIVKQRHVSNAPLKMEVKSQPKSRSSQSPAYDNDLAKSLGITIQGFQPPVASPQAQDLKPSANIGDTALLDQDGENSTDWERIRNTESFLTSNSGSRRRDATPQKSALENDQKELASEETVIPKSSSGKKKKDVKTPSKNSTPTSRATPNSSKSLKRNITPLSGKKTPKRIRTPLGRVALTPKPRLLSINSTKAVSDSEEEEEIDDEKKLASEPDQIVSDGSTDATDGILSVNSAITFVTWIVVILSSIFGFWYYEQKYLVGYCGQEIDQPTFEESSISLIGKLGNALDTYCKPNCVPCPQHARCFTNLELGCFEDFMEFKPWYDFFSPGHKKCIPDTKKAEKLEIMIDVALDLLRSRNAAVDCGKGSDDNQSGISVQDLHDLLLSMKAPYITTEEFEELWSRSIVELTKEPDIILRQVRFADISPGKYTLDANNTPSKAQDKVEILRSTSLSNISLRCQIQSSIMGNVSRYKYWILTLILSALSFKAIQSKFRRHQLEKIKVDILYQEVLDKLINQVRLARDTPSINRYIGANQLRDLILSNEDDLSERVRLWNFVGCKIENNTNVASKIIENHGEIMKVWEWISADEAR